MGSSSDQGMSGSEMAVISGPPRELAPTVHIMTIGNQFASVTQNVKNAEPVNACSGTLCVLLLRLSCACAALTLVLCTTFILYFAVLFMRGELNIVDEAPHEWNITREHWQARDHTDNTTVTRFAPLKLVVVQHTVGPECHRFTICAAVLRSLQRYYLQSKDLGYDIPYNYLIGNDGRVYQGRGWNREGAHTYGYNRCSLGVAFIGNYSEELPIQTRVTDLQLQRFNMLLEDGVAMGFLRPDYTILPAMDVRDTTSPGSNLYRALKKLEHYERTHSFRGMNCEAIYNKLGLPYHL